MDNNKNWILRDKWRVKHSKGVSKAFVALAILLGAGALATALGLYFSGSSSSLTNGANSVRVNTNGDLVDANNNVLLESVSSLSKVELDRAYAPTAGATFTGAVSGVAPTEAANLVTKAYVDNLTVNLTPYTLTTDLYTRTDADNTFFLKAGGEVTGAVLTTRTTGFALNEFVPKSYIDDRFNNIDLTAYTQTVDLYTRSQAELTFLALTGGALTGPVSGVAPTLNTHLTTKQYVDDADNLKLNLAGGILTGSVSGIAPTLDAHLTTKKYVDDAGGLKLNLAGGILTGSVSGIAPTLDAHLTTKKYVDDAGGLKLDLAGGVLTGPISGIAPTLDAHLTTKKYVDDAANLRLALTGGVLTGPVSGIAPILDAHITTKKYVDDADNLKLNLAGGVLTGPVSGIAPTLNAHLTTKQYVDDADNLKLDLTGGILTGTTSVLVNPVNDDDIATKRYVDENLRNLNTPTVTSEVKVITGDIYKITYNTVDPSDLPKLELIYDTPQAATVGLQINSQVTLADGNSYFVRQTAAGVISLDYSYQLVSSVPTRNVSNFFNVTNLRDTGRNINYIFTTNTALQGITLGSIHRGVAEAYGTRRSIEEIDFSILPVTQEFTLWGFVNQAIDSGFEGFLYGATFTRDANGNFNLVTVPGGNNLFIVPLNITNTNGIVTMTTNDGNDVSLFSPTRFNTVINRGFGVTFINVPNTFRVLKKTRGADLVTNDPTRSESNFFSVAPGTLAGFTDVDGNPITALEGVSYGDGASSTYGSRQPISRVEWIPGINYVFWAKSHNLLFGVIYTYNADGSLTFRGGDESFFGSGRSATDPTLLGSTNVINDFNPITLSVRRASADLFIPATYRIVIRPIS